jgi:predicted nucleotidyltransferase
MALTALDLSPEELKQYRPREAVRRRAHAAARKAAELLKTKFGAKEVILLGSLARRGGFTLYSDIDLAERGILSDRYLTAMDTVLHLDSEFKIDLIDIKTCLPTLRAEIEKEGKAL